MTLVSLRIFVPAILAFMVGIGGAPILTYFLYKYHCWKKRAGKVALDGTEATEYNRLHGNRVGDERSTPRMGGILIWGSVLIVAALLQIPAWLLGTDATSPWAFVSRGQTWIPFALLLAGAVVGFFDDWYEILGKGGLRLRTRLGFVAAVALLAGWWFYAKVGISTVSLLFTDHTLSLGVWFIPFFMLVTLVLYAGGVIDGIDGLSGGVFASAFAAYAGIAFFLNSYDLAAFCAAVTGAILAFLWFNIPPARFYMTETGSMGLTITLAAVAVLTDTHAGGKGLAVLPVIGLLLLATVASNVLQVLWKKILHRKLFRIAPLHHHFEAIGWPSYKVTMRYWVMAIILAIAGITLAFV